MGRGRSQKSVDSKWTKDKTDIFFLALTSSSIYIAGVAVVVVVVEGVYRVLDKTTRKRAIKRKSHVRIAKKAKPEKLLVCTHTNKIRPSLSFIKLWRGRLLYIMEQLAADDLSPLTFLTCNATRAASVKASLTPRFFMAEHSVQIS